jgi:FSR family fosmidomycin resistance protein-like MFS transporter
MGQELLPRSLGVASGLVMGLGFVASGLGVFLTGLLADAYGLQSALLGLGLMPFLGVVLAALLPGRSRQAPVQETGARRT